MQELLKLQKYASERGFDIISVQPIVNFDKIGVPEFDNKKGLTDPFPPEFYLLGVKIQMVK